MSAPRLEEYVAKFTTAADFCARLIGPPVSLEEYIDDVMEMVEKKSEYKEELNQAFREPVWRTMLVHICTWHWYEMIKSFESAS